LAFSGFSARDRQAATRHRIEQYTAFEAIFAGFGG
jgi:hypothetical protein